MIKYMSHVEGTRKRNEVEGGGILEGCDNSNDSGFDQAEPTQPAYHQVLFINFSLITRV